jgi:hypothetical protein
MVLAMGVREPLEGSARRWILLKGPGRVVGRLDLARLDVRLDPDPDAIPDPDPGGLLDLLAEPNIGPLAVHRHGRSEGTSLTVALTLGRAVPYAALTSNGNSTSGSRPSRLPTTASNSCTFMPGDSTYVRGWTTTLECFAAAADRS